MAQLSKQAAEELHWQALRRYLGMWHRAQDERKQAAPAPKDEQKENQGEFKL